MTMPPSFSVTFRGFNSLEEAEAFLAWFSNSGEQEAGEHMASDDTLDRRVSSIGMHYPTKTEGRSVTADIEVNYEE